MSCLCLCRGSAVSCYVCCVVLSVYLTYIRTVCEAGLKPRFTPHLSHKVGRAGHLTRPNTFSMSARSRLGGSRTASFCIALPFARRASSREDSACRAAHTRLVRTPVRNRDRRPEIHHEPGCRGGSKASSVAMPFAGKGNLFRQLLRIWVAMAGRAVAKAAKNEAAYGSRVKPGGRSWAVLAVLLGSWTSTKQARPPLLRNTRSIVLTRHPSDRL